VKVLRGTFETGLLLWRVFNNLLSRSNLLVSLHAVKILVKTKTSKFGAAEIDIRYRPLVVNEFLSHQVKIVGISSIELTINRRLNYPIQFGK